jgi:hypothetical protein
MTAGPALYPASPIKRRRRTNAEIVRLDGRIVDLVAADKPMTVRQTFYGMAVRGHVPKAEKEGYGFVQRRLVKLRRDRVVPYGWITDSTRWQRKPDTYTGLRHALRATATFYRRALWADQPVYVEVWCEKDALAGVLYDVTEAYDVPLMVSRGYSSITYLHEAGEAIRAVGKPAFISYFGDHDPSGVDIPRKIEAGLRAAAGDAVPITFIRAAVTPEQIARWNLPTRPTKASDSRAKGFAGDSVELDAIPAPTLREIVRGCIERHLDAEQLEVLRAAEESERELLWRWANERLEVGP